MTNGIAFLKELTAKLDKRPELALLWSLLWMFMMLSLKFDGIWTAHIRVFPRNEAEAGNHIGVDT